MKHHRGEEIRCCIVVVVRLVELRPWCGVSLALRLSQLWPAYFFASLLLFIELDYPQLLNLPGEDRGSGVHSTGAWREWIVLEARPASVKERI